MMSKFSQNNKEQHVMQEYLKQRTSKVLLRAVYESIEHEIGYKYKSTRGQLTPIEPITYSNPDQALPKLLRIMGPWGAGSQQGTPLNWPKTLNKKRTQERVDDTRIEHKCDLLT